MSTSRRPFTGRHLVNRRLSQPGSEKCVHHHEIGIEDGPLPYLPGDAIGVHPQNDSALVERIIQALGARGTEPVVVADGTTTSLEDALRRSCSLSPAGRKLLALLGSASDAVQHKTPGSGRNVPRPESTRQADAAPDVLDVLESRGDVRIGPVEFVAALRRLLPRLYSVASSPLASPGRVHLLVAAVRYQTRGRERRGVASSWLDERWPIGATGAFFLQSQQAHFAMPSAPETDMIMVGPGTGVAPFRGFLQHRRAIGAGGRNWLFFGDQRRASDFVYEDEFNAYVRDGWLRLDLAFSRDQPRKIYVQDCLRDRAAEIWEWLEHGAEFFVCGNKDRMAADVDLALRDIVETAGRRTSAEAAQYVAELARQGRYKRDIY
jgi:sulfite reductase (NADPH) flavoprotein alpha-component